MWGSTMYLVSVLSLGFDTATSLDLIRITNNKKILTSPHNTSITDTGRIVGGYKASIEDHPYQAFFDVYRKGNKSRSCGAFIIDKYYVLTAAHCVPNIEPSMVILRAGNALKTNGTIIPVRKVISHPEYNDPKFDKDVAVIRTAEPIEFTDVIQPIKLPPKGRKLVPDSKVVVTGWGKTKYTASTTPKRLRAVEIPVVDHDRCSQVYDMLTANEWCGGNFYLGGKGTCQGDSGGAAIQDGMAVGIVSYGRGCGYRKAPSVFADIAAPTIRDFIFEHTGL